MRSGCLLFIASAVAASPLVIKVRDEAGRPLSEAMIRVVTAPADDPRLSSVRELTSVTDERGDATVEIADRSSVIRLMANKGGRYPADVTDGLPSGPRPSTFTLTLPTEQAGEALCFKEVLLTTEAGTLPPRRWVGFDLAAGEAVAPFGRGLTSDLSFWNEGKQTGWTESEAFVAKLRSDDDARLISDDLFARRFGRFQGETKIETSQPGAGIVRTDAFWPYCLLKMPAEAPLAGYQRALSLSYDTVPYPRTSDDHTGFYLRVRPTLDADGQLLSAHYAKIHGRIATGHGWVRFRYYYNPRANDRKLVFAPGRNLLRPTGAKGDDTAHYETTQP